MMGDDTESRARASGTIAGGRVGSRASHPISIVHGCALLLQLRLQRMGRSFGLAGSAAHGAAARRSAISAQGDLSWLWKALRTSVGVLVVTGLGMTQLFSLTLTSRLAGGELESAASAQLSLLCLAVLCFEFGWANRMSARGAGDIEWLLTLPIPLPAIYAVEVFQRACFNICGWCLLYPFVLGLVRHAGLFWSAPLVGALLSFTLSLAVSLSSVIIEHGLRRLTPSVFKTVQVVATFASLGLMITLPVHVGLSAPLRAWPWLPTDAVAGVIFALSSTPAVLLGQLGLFVVQTCALFGLGCGVLSWIFATGWRLGEGSRASTRGSRMRASLRFQRPSSGVFAKDVKQLLRDKAMLYMAVLLPLFQLFLLASVITARSAGSLIESSQHLPMLAFSVGVMSLMAGAPSALALEGTSLWLLFTLPRSLAFVLLKKALLWIVLSAAWVASILAFGLLHQSLSWALLGGASHALLGVALLALAGTAQGVHCVDLRMLERGERSFRGSSALGLLVVLAAVFAFGFYADAWTRFSLALLLGAATFGIWQTAARQLPYLLDPELKPPPIVSLSDGLTCALVFTGVQGVGYLLLTESFGLHGWLARLASFFGAGALVIAVTLVVLRRRGVTGLLSTIGLAWPAHVGLAVRHGLAWGAPAAVIGLCYALALSRWSIFTEAARASADTSPAMLTGVPFLSFVALATVLAPLTEELIFRGLIYRGLRISLSINQSAALAGVIFALAHPGWAFLPVFLMAFFAARAFERSKSLFAAILVHAMYNGTLVLVAALGT